MTRIVCRVSDCAFWEHGICGAEEIEYDLDDGCLTFQEMLEMDLEDSDEAHSFNWGIPVNGFGQLLGEMSPFSFRRYIQDCIEA